MTDVYNRRKNKAKRKRLRANSTETERFLWHHLCAKRLAGYKFHRQYGIGSYIVDFYCPAARLVIELDDGQHGLPESRDYDDRRTSYLNGVGIQVIRFWNANVFESLDVVLEVIRAAVVRTPSGSPFGTRGIGTR
jgi:very-short-patch-repair endonuclease